MEENKYVETNLGEKFEPSEKHSFSFLYPSELRKNKNAPPCHPLINCSTPQSTALYHEWMSKEWEVYLSEIQLVRREMKQCLIDDKVVDATRGCGFLMRHYVELSSDKNLEKARNELYKTGKPLVDEKGFEFYFI
eukprot:gene5188-8794_t